MPDIAVGVAQQSEYEAVCRLYDEVIAENGGTQYDVLWNREMHPSDAQIADAIDAGCMLVMRRDDELLGAMVFNDDTADGYENVPWGVEATPEEIRVVHLFCIHPALQGQKLGRRFLVHTIEYARELGVKAIRLDVFDYNEPAKHLYESVGFVSRAISKLGYEDQDAVGNIDFNMMELVL